MRLPEELLVRRRRRGDGGDRYDEARRRRLRMGEVAASRLNPRRSSAERERERRAEGMTAGRWAGSRSIGRRRGQPAALS